MAQKKKKKRTVRVTTELGRIGTKRQGSGWAARQAARQHNRGRKISMRTIRKRMRRKTGAS